MKRALVVTAVVLAATVALFGLTRARSSDAKSSPGGRGTSGAWTAYAKDHDPGKIQLSLDLDGDGNMGAGFDLLDFTGLAVDEIDAAERVPVRFEMRREAGTITFDGTFRAGRGAGDFAFVPNLAYVRELDRMDLKFEARRGDEARELFHLAMFDVSTGFIRSMRAIGYDEPLEKYVAFRIFKVDPAYVRAMAAVGFAELSADKLVETKVHDVSPEYVRAMRASGEDLTLDELVQSRIFQVTPEFAAEMERIGYPGLDRDRLVQFRIHGVSPEFVADLRELGYSKVDPDQLVAMKIHGVTPEFIRRVEKAGFHDVPVDKLVQMRIFDIDPGMIGALDDHDDD